jgi:hypothetical protein
MSRGLPGLQRSLAALAYPVVPPVGSDLLRWRLIGPLLRQPRARTTYQILLLIVAGVVVLHGLLGPDIAPTNLATLLTWVHFRGLLIVTLLAAGNLFCMGCPFTLVRDAGRRIHPPAMRWPRVLRTKWLGIALLITVLFVYELFDLWSLPRATAQLVVIYFAAALTIDLLFTDATFCKYLCPIGQFNFVASTMSPLELRIKAADTCASCQTVDCIKGTRSVEAPSRIVRRGCELALFLPLKAGNIDCTFCLDCVRACPHDNVALATRVPGAELGFTGWRSGIGRLTGRPDLAALAIVFVFGGILNAFAMVSPVYAVERWLSQASGGAPEGIVLAIVFAVGLGVVPLALLGMAASATAWLARHDNVAVVPTMIGYAYALVPFGCAVWLAHYGFHLLTGAATIVPAVQNAAVELAGRPLLGGPYWSWVGMRPGTVFPIQLGFILLGTVASLGTAYRVAHDRSGHGLRDSAAWGLVTIVLAAFTIWVMWQPMEMRGIGIGFLQ